MTGKERFISSLKKFLPPPEPVAPPADLDAEAWLEFRVRQLEARQQWFQRMLFLVVLAILVETLGVEKVKEILALIP